MSTWYEPEAFSASSEGAGDPPSIGLLVTVVERFKFLLPLLPAEACGVANSEESRCELHQPARVDGGHLPHVLLGCQHQLMVNKPEEKRVRTETQLIMLRVATNDYFLQQ